MSLDCFSSWSGGKDSCLAIYKAIQDGYIPKYLFTMICDDQNKSRSHGLSLDILHKQSESLKIPLMHRKSSWDEYESNFIDFLDEIKNKGISTGIFGDIDLEPHLEWITRVTSLKEIKPVLPLWQRDRDELINEFIDLGFEAKIVVVNNNYLSSEFLGRKVDKSIIKEFQDLGVDACGENGEFHTVVTNGPIFNFPLNLQQKEIYSINNYSFMKYEA